MSADSLSYHWALPEGIEVRRALGRLQGSVSPATPPGVKWVDAEGLHLTLKFLGAVSAERLGLVSAAVVKTVAGVAPLSLAVEGLGVFPDPHRPRVLWVGLVGEVDRLSGLQQAIESALTPLGFSRENRPFVPHLTLARLRQDVPLPERQGLARLFLAAPLEPLPPSGFKPSTS